MALFDDLGEGVRKVFLAGVGAIAISAEKSTELINDLVKKGELTVEQGKSLNEELTRKAKESYESTQDAFLKAHLESMSDEDRAAYIERILKANEEINKKATEAETVEAVVEEVETEDCEEAADTPADEA